MPNGIESRLRPPILGNSPSVQGLRQEIIRVARTNFHVLIRGERGTGKELVAYELHLSSDRSDNEFLTFTAGTLDPGTANSELFGHVPGAYTGAVKKRDGLFRKADHGTLFLDEIGNIPLELQGRLLRAV